MKYLASLIILSLGLFSAYGQGTVTLSGQVKDEQTSNALEFCNVSYYSFQDSLISGTATDQKGFYTAELAMGNYKQIISYIGNLSDTAILFAYESKFLGIYSLKTDVHMLGEASVTANSRSREIDRKS